MSLLQAERQHMWNDFARRFYSLIATGENLFVEKAAIGQPVLSKGV